MAKTSIWDAVYVGVDEQGIVAGVRDPGGELRWPFASASILILVSSSAGRLDVTGALDADALKLRVDACKAPSWAACN